MIEITEAVARKVLTTIDAGLVYGVGYRKPGHMCVEAAVCYALGLPHGDDPPCVSPALRSLKISLNDRRWSSPDARARGLRRLGLAQLGSAGHLDDVEFARRVATLTIRTCVPPALRSAALVHTEHKEKLLGAADKCEVEATSQSVTEAQTAAAEAYAWVAAKAAEAAWDAEARAAEAYAWAAEATVAYAVEAVADGEASYWAVEAAARAAEAAAYAADAAARASASAHTRDRSLADFAEGVVKVLIEMDAPGCRWLFLTEQEAA